MTGFSTDAHLREASHMFPVGSRVTRSRFTGDNATGTVVSATAFGRDNAEDYIGGAFYANGGEGPFLALEWDHAPGRPGAAYDDNLRVVERAELVSQTDDHGFPLT